MGKFKWDLGKRASSLSHVNAMKILIIGKKLRGEIIGRRNVPLREIIWTVLNITGHASGHASVICKLVKSLHNDVHDFWPCSFVVFELCCLCFHGPMFHHVFSALRRVISTVIGREIGLWIVFCFLIIPFYDNE